MNRQQLQDALLAAPQRVYEAEGNLHAAKLAVVAAKDALADVEAYCVLRTQPNGTPFLDGRNEAARQAQLLQMTDVQREALRNAEAAALAFERDYNLAAGHFRALRSVAALLAGAEDH